MYVYGYTVCSVVCGVRESRRGAQFMKDCVDIVEIVRVAVEKTSITGAAVLVRPGSRSARTVCRHGKSMKFAHDRIHMSVMNMVEQPPMSLFDMQSAVALHLCTLRCHLPGASTHIGM